MTIPCHSQCYTHIFCLWKIITEQIICSALYTKKSTHLAAGEIDFTFRLNNKSIEHRTKKFQCTLFGTTRLLSLFEFHLSDMQKFFSFLSPSVHTFPKDPHTCPINTQTLTQTGSLPCFLSECISLCFILTRERQSSLRPQTI